MSGREPADSIAIIGIGALFPKADGRDAYWANVQEGVDAITPVPDTHWDPADYYDADPSAPDMTYARRGGFLSPLDFDPLAFGITPNAIEATDTSQLLALVATQRALDDAGYGADREFDRSRVSVVLGVTGTLELVIPLGARLGHPIWRKALREAGVADDVAEDVVKRISAGYVPWQEASFPGLLGNVVAGRVASRFDLHGTNCVVDAACASSLSALHLASMELRSGKSDLVVAGGADTFNDIFMYMCFSKTPALSPTGNAKPFDHAADGTILGEGIGIVVLKRLADADRDGDRVYAVVRGIGTSSDGRGNAIYAPSDSGQARCLRDAYATSGVSPDTIQLVEAHGTGTKVGDATEVNALTEVYRDARAEGAWCALGSVKSQIGHTKAAAGIAGVIKTALALHHKVLPPTIKVERPHPDLATGETPFYVNTEKRPWLPSREHPRRAGTSSFGFGGSNYHCVLEEHGATKPSIDWDRDVQILAFHAETQAELDGKLAAWPTAADWEDLRVRAAATRRGFDASAPCRLLVVLERGHVAAAKVLASARAQLAREPDADAWATPDGAFFGAGPAAGSLAAIFSGQGCQYVGMLRDLACRFPAFQEVLAEANDAFDGALGDRIYAYPAFDDATRERQEEELRDTRVAQPALGAVSLGALRVLEGFGVAFASAAGHSYGELTALRAADRLDDDAFHALSALRGRLMAETEGESGTMAAVAAGRDAVHAIVDETGIDVSLANDNAPGQIVISGGEAAVDAMVAALAERGIACKRLPVSAAFHSPLVAQAAEPLRAALEDVEFPAGRFPVFANTTGDPYPDDADACRDLLAGQIAHSVEFLREVRAMHDAGARTFVEIGPGRKIAGLVKRCLADQPHDVLAVDASGGRRRGMADLALALARIAALGHAVDLGLWDPAAPMAESTGRPSFTVPISGANYTQPREPIPPRPPAPAAPTLTPAPASTAAAASAPGALPDALRVARENMAALQRLQEQTADLHRKFLEGQEAAQRALHALLAQQQGAVHASLGLPALPTPTFAAPPPPVAPVPQPVAPAVPPPVAPAPVAPAAAPVASRVVSPGAAETLLAIVAEKTGYPADMLDLSMELDADLGIDSIKRVEILSAVQEQIPGAPEVKSEQLGQFRTLADVVDYIGVGAPAAVAAAVVAASAPSADTSGILLAIVAEKTGYPADMLDLSMELDADLGIDSIKRVEILSAVQEQIPGAPEVKSEQLGQFRTLADVVAYLGEGASSPAPSAAAAVASVASDASDASDASALLLEVVAEKTGYPVEMLELSMELDTDLGIDSIKRVEILSAMQEQLPGAPEVRSEQLGAFRTLADVVAFLHAGEEAPVDPTPAPAIAPTSAPEPEPLPAAPRVVPLQRSVLEFGPLNGASRVPVRPAGTVWVTEDDAGLAAGIVEALSARDVDALLIDPAAPPEVVVLGGLVVVDAPLGVAFRVIRHAGRALCACGDGVLLTVARIDGAFGLDEGVLEPAAGGLAGLAKTAGHEWRKVACKAIDVCADVTDLAAAAEAVADEVLVLGPDEVGISDRGLSALSLRPAAIPAPNGLALLEPGDVVVVSGGARGVTAEVALALAVAHQPTLLLLGRSPAPGEEPDWLGGLGGEAEVKRALIAHTDGGSPREINVRYREIAAAREIRANFERLEAAGATVLYRSVDVRDADAVAAAVEEARLIGDVRGVVHGAGVLADSLIEEKTDEQFDRVVGTKVGGLVALLDATADDDLRFLALFSSSTGRFGRRGQADYAAANEVLNKVAQRESRRRPRCRVVSVNWGPWEGGMVTPGHRQLFESEGVGLIPLEQGAHYLLAELAAPAGDRPVEVVVIAGLPGAPVAPPGGDAALVLAFERTLDVNRHTFLRSHVIDGRPVLPVAMMIEWLAHGALHGNPGLSFNGVDELRVLKGVTLADAAPAPLRVYAGPTSPVSDGLAVPVELRGVTGDGSETLHARAVVVLAPSMPTGSPRLEPASGDPYDGDRAAIYGERLFHGEHFHAIDAVDVCTDAGIAASVRTAPAPAEWIHQPLRGAWIADPLAIDAAFQLMILWSRVHRGAPSLPCRVGRYRQFVRSFPRDGVRIIATVTKATDHSGEADVEFVDASGALVARIEGCEGVIDASLDAAFRRRALPQGV